MEASTLKRLTIVGTSEMTTEPRAKKMGRITIGPFQVRAALMQASFEINVPNPSFRFSMVSGLMRLPGFFFFVFFDIVLLCFSKVNDTFFLPL